MKVCIECDGPLHFFVNDKTRPLGKNYVRDSLLRAMGWNLLCINHIVRQRCRFNTSGCDCVCVVYPGVCVC